MALIGYARISTEDQTPRPQTDELRAAGCHDIREEQASCASRTRPVLAHLLDQIRAGDVLLMVRIDRLARSLSHLLQVIDRLEAKGALIRERTVAGLRSAKAQGRIGGNPGLSARDPAAIRHVTAARDAAYFAKISACAQDWVPQVRRLRPAMAWQDLVRLINAPCRSPGTGPLNF